MDKIMIYWKIPMGYEIIKRTRDVDLYTAGEILKSRKQKCITIAKRVGNRAEIVSHYIKCPHCGKETPAYAHYLNENSCALPKKSKIEIDGWANIQLSLLGEPDEELKIQEYEDFSREYICPECGYSSNKSNEYTELYIDYVDGKLYVKRAIKNLSEFVLLKWLNGSTAIEFPVYEQVVFDFEAGSTYMEFISDKKVVCTTPVTDSEIDFTGDILIDLFSKSNIVKRTIRSCFEKITSHKMPFTTNELDIDKFVNFVRFTGFPKEFYEAIPFWKGSRVVDESFKQVYEWLGNSESAMKLLEKSSIPYCKSIKRLFAKRSGLFFYIKECEFLYGLLNDVNLFCAFLNKKYIFQLLSMMHYYETPMKTFLSDYSAALEKSRFINNLYCFDYVISYAIYYNSLSAYVQKKEREKWLLEKNIFRKAIPYSQRANEISAPISLVASNMKDTIVDKYRFKYLRTKQECVVAGERMDNCLVKWDSCSNPVVAIYKGDKIVAAVEFLNNVLVQAKECRNKSIEPNSDLYNAIEKWCKRNSINFDSEKLDDCPF